MNPMPPTTCGTQNTPSRTPVRGSIALCIAGRAVNLHEDETNASERLKIIVHPLIQKIEAASN